MDNALYDRKSIRRKRRNLVSKYNKFVGHKHTPKVKYSRKSKHPASLQRS